MKKFAIRMLVLASLCMMSACGDNDGVEVPSQVQSVFSEMFPSASRVEWERRGAYLVADFYDDGYDADAWFDAAGVWYMTETEIPYRMLPAAVRTAFETGDYAAWKVEGVEKVERPDKELLYVIEAERGAAEYDLCYSEDGTLVRAVPDDDRRYDDLLPR